MVQHGCQSKEAKMNTQIKSRLIPLGKVSRDTRAIVRVGSYEGFLPNLAWI